MNSESLQIPQRLDADLPNAELVDAVRSKDLQRVEAALTAGANPNTDFAPGRPLVWLAVQGGNPAILGTLVRHGASGKDVGLASSIAMRIAIDQYNAEALGGFLRAGCDPNAVAEPHEMTMLHHAAWEILEAGTKLLLDAGADPNVLDDEHRTPLHIASSMGDQAPTVKLLLNRGADPVVADKRGRTPLHQAASNRNPRVVRLLIGHGAPIDQRDHKRWTPLHYTTAHSTPAAVILLLRAGANPNAKDNHGNTPLHFAARTIYRGVVAALLNADAVPDAVNHAGCTPLELAVGPSTGWGAASAVTLLDRGARAPKGILVDLFRNTVRRAGDLWEGEHLVEALSEDEFLPRC